MTTTNKTLKIRVSQTTSEETMQRIAECCSKFYKSSAEKQVRIMSQFYELKSIEQYAESEFLEDLINVLKELQKPLRAVA